MDRHNIPQIYWEIGNKAADYVALVKWWDKNANGGHLYVSQDVARTLKASWTKKMAYIRSPPIQSENCGRGK